MSAWNNRGHEASDIYSKTMRWGCYFIFSLFSFLYLYCYQGPVLAAFQHVLSEGVTSYDNLIGAILITVFLLLVQLAVKGLYRKKNIFALSFYPSFLLLALLTNVNASIGAIYLYQHYLLLVALITIIWAIVYFKLGNNLYAFIQRRSSFLSHDTWLNTALMSLMMLFTGLVGNGNDIFHNRMKIEQELMQGNADIEKYVTFAYDKTNAADIENGSSVTMLNAHRLAKSGQMGEALFKGTVVGRSTDLLPLADSKSACVIYNTDSVFKVLGAKPSVPMSTRQYLKIIDKLYPNNKVIGDYMLCGHLVDRRLDKFVDCLPKYYSPTDTLPLHYREALLLMGNRKDLAYQVGDEQLAADYAAFVEIEKSYQQAAHKRLKTWERYAGTYWWYYKYGSK